jgi:hypothetical protein
MEITGQHMYTSFSFLLALQPCVDLGRFVTVNFSEFWSTPRPNPTCRTGNHTTLRSVALPVAYAAANIALRVIGARKPALHVKAVVLDEEHVYLGPQHVMCTLKCII